MVGWGWMRLVECLRGWVSHWKLLWFTDRLGEYVRGWVSQREVGWDYHRFCWSCMKLADSVRGWVSLWEIGWVCESLGESVSLSDIGLFCERWGDSVRDWVSLWWVRWVFARLCESVRGYVSVWKVGWVCERLGESSREWVSLQKVVWVYEKLVAPGWIGCNFLLRYVMISLISPPACRIMVDCNSFASGSFICSLQEFTWRTCGLGRCCPVSCGTSPSTLLVLELGRSLSA